MSADPRPVLAHPLAVARGDVDRDLSHTTAQPADRALDLLLRAAERGLQMGVTVSVPGAVVSGTLIGAATYFRALADQFAGHHGTDMDEEFAEAFRRVVDDAHREAGEHTMAAESVGDAPVAFLHLTEARYVGGAAFLPHGRYGVLWRCRVTAISGWSPGNVVLG